MAYFAKLDENNIVLKVIKISNKDVLDENGVEREEVGIAYCENLLGGRWKQTSYNNKIRKNYAGIGYRYDADLDAFIPPQSYDSWKLNEETAQWEAPEPRPDLEHEWDEDSKSWIIPVDPEDPK